jgi:hypothetical protein
MIVYKLARHSTNAFTYESYMCRTLGLSKAITMYRVGEETVAPIPNSRLFVFKTIKDLQYHIAVIENLSKHRKDIVVLECECDDLCRLEHITFNDLERFWKYFDLNGEFTKAHISAPTNSYGTTKLTPTKVISLIDFFNTEYSKDENSKNSCG